MKISVGIMCKDEESNILTTLYSIKDFADILYIYDTGSTDKTIDKIKKFCKTYSIELRLIEGKFVDFSTSRNVLLKYMDSFEDTTYVLLMDVGDVLNGKEDLKKMIPQLTDSAYNVLQKWKLDDGTDTDFYNVRLIKTNEGWKYFREIHEVLINDDKTKFNPNKFNDEIYLYQNRQNDNGKSQKRFLSDRDLLLKNYHKHKDNPNRNDNDFYRDLYYLGQTYLCIGEIPGQDKNDCYKQALKYFSLRGEFLDAPYKEETYNALFFKANISDVLSKPTDDVLLLYLKCAEFDATRIEPLIAIGQYYYDKKKFVMAFMYINFACRHDTPEVSMNFNKLNWDYVRWRLLSLICLELGKGNIDLFKAGKEALDVAIDGYKKHGEVLPLDLELQKLYIDIDNKLNIKPSSNTDMELKTI